MAADQGPKKISQYLKYSGIAFQLAALMAVGIFGGQWLDQKLGLQMPICTMILVLLFFGVYMYKLYLDLTSKK